MTENEIIECLKENKTKGVAFMFMPKEVQNWISENYNNPKLLYFTQKAEWKSFDKIDDNYDNVVVFALPDDFKVKEEPKGEWVEFKIRDDGYFNSDIGLYLWFDWQNFLKFSYNHDIGFTSFGGWQYENDERWYLAPTIQLKCGTKWNSYIIKDVGEVKPAIPIKIRFWRR